MYERLSNVCLYINVAIYLITDAFVYVVLTLQEIDVLNERILDHSEHQLTIMNPNN